MQYKINEDRWGEYIFIYRLANVLERQQASQEFDASNTVRSLRTKFNKV